MSLKSKILLSLNEDLGDKKITNPETGRKIKYSTALSYQDENPSLFQKVKNLIAKIRGNKSEEPKPNQEEPKPNQEDKEIEQRRQNFIAGKKKGNQMSDEFNKYSENNDKKIAILSKFAMGQESIGFFRGVLEKTSDKDLDSLISDVEGNIELANDYNDNEKSKIYKTMSSLLNRVKKQREVGKDPFISGSLDGSDKKSNKKKSSSSSDPFRINPSSMKFR